MSLNKDWYTMVDIPEPKPLSERLMFWKKKYQPPVTTADKQWIEESLLWLAEVFDPFYFKTLPTITPDKEYFDYNFNHTEEDADFILKRLTDLMNIDGWEIGLMFFSEEATEFSEGLRTSRSGKLKDRWSSSPTKFVDNGLGNKEIWIDLNELKDTESLIAVIAHELAYYRLSEHCNPEDVDQLLVSLTAVAFGVGIFMGNSYFKFAQWQGHTHRGWRMRKSGYLPEQVIAYAMAWLAHYRGEGISWKQYLNTTMTKYFDQSYQYIAKNIDEVRFN